MSAEFEFENKQWQSFLTKINKKFKDINNRKEFSDLVSIIAFGDIVDHFDKEIGPSGKWTKWSKIYRKHLERIGRGGNKILQFSGRLRKSILPNNGKKRSNSLGILPYTNVIYASTHQYGYKNIPARPFMWMSKDGMKRLVMATEKWLLE